MGLDNKTLWRGRCIQGAAWQLVDAIAAVAMKMVMMPPAGALINRAQTGMLHLGEPAAFNQEFQVAVHRGLVQAGYQEAAMFQNVFQAKRPTGIAENLLNRLALHCFSLHTPASLFLSNLVSPLRQNCKASCPELDSRMQNGKQA